MDIELRWGNKRTFLLGSSTIVLLLIVNLMMMMKWFFRVEKKLKIIFFLVEKFEKKFLFDLIKIWKKKNFIEKCLNNLFFWLNNEKI